MSARTEHNKKTSFLRKVGGFCIAIVAAVGGHVIGEKIKLKFQTPRHQNVVKILPEAISLVSFAAAEELTREKDSREDPSHHAEKCLSSKSSFGLDR